MFYRGLKRSNAFFKVMKLVNDGGRITPKFLTKIHQTFHDINAVLSMDSIKHLCCYWHENHFLWIEVSGCLHTPRLMRATLPACLYARAFSSAWSTAEGWKAKCWCSSFDRSLKASRVVCEC